MELVDAGRRFAFGPPTPSSAPGSRSTTRAPTAGRCAAAPASARATSRACGAATTSSPCCRIACRSLPPLDRLRAALQPLLRPGAGARRPRSAQHPGRRRAEHLRPLRPRRAALRGLPRPAAGLLLRASSRAPRPSLEDAQLAKLERVCAALDLGPDDHLLEIGTGWGGLAIHAAATRGCRVTTTTISRNQHAYAVERVRAEGLADRVEVLLTDYRDLGGTYDKLASIEMIEAVGWQYFPTFFERCAELTRPGGAMFLQAIVIADDLYEQEKDARTFANKHVFPGGCLPSLELIAELARATGMPVERCEDITADYARTLAALARALQRGPGPSCGRSATTSASRGCGTSTSPPRRRAFASGGSATCSWCSQSRAGSRTATDGDRAHPHGKRRASRPDPRPRGVAANLEPGARAARGRARRDRRRPARASASRRASRGRRADAGQPRRRDRPSSAPSSGSSVRTWPATRSAPGWRWSSPRPAAAASVCAISPAGLWRRPLGPRRVDAHGGPRGCARCSRCS